MVRRILPAVSKSGFVALAMAVFCSHSAESYVGLVAGAGGVGGSFAKENAAYSHKGYGFSAELTYHPESKGAKLWPFFLGVNMKQAKLGYTENNIKKSASYNCFGAYLGLHLPMSDNFSLNVLANYLPYADLTTLSTNSVRLNGQNFRYATYEEYKGKPAFEGRLNFTHDKTSGGFSKNNRFRSGIGIAYLQQVISEETSEISTSNDDIAPQTTVTKSEVDYSLLMVTVDFFIGLTF